MRMTLRNTLIIMALFLMQPPTCSCSIENPSFLDVSGQFGKAWLDEYHLSNPPPVKQSPRNDLWSWGGAPKGGAIAFDRLVPAANLTPSRGDWLMPLPPGSGDALYSWPYGYGAVYPYSYITQDPWTMAQILGWPVRTTSDYTPFYGLLYYPGQTHTNLY